MSSKSQTSQQAHPFQLLHQHKNITIKYCLISQPALPQKQYKQHPLQQKQPEDPKQPHRPKQKQKQRQRLKLKLIYKNEHKINQIYETVIYDTDLIDYNKNRRKGSVNASEFAYRNERRLDNNNNRLAQFFQDLTEVKDYLAQGHYKVIGLGENDGNITNLHPLNSNKKVLQIFAKGPTKKSSQIKLLQLPLSPVILPSLVSNLSQSSKGLNAYNISNSSKNNNEFNQNLNQNFKVYGEKDSVSSRQASQWVDTLAMEIADIIQSKSRIMGSQKQLQKIVQDQRQWVRRSQLNGILDQFKNDIFQTIKKDLKHIVQPQQNKSQNPTLSQQKPQQPPASSCQQLQTTKIKQQLKILSEKINSQVQTNQQTISKIHQNILSQVREQIKNKLKEEKEKISELQSRLSNFKAQIVSQEEIDVVIGKIQVLGNQVQTLMLENAKKKEKDGEQDKKLVELMTRINSQANISQPRQRTEPDYDPTPIPHLPLLSLQSAQSYQAEQTPRTPRILEPTVSLPSNSYSPYPTMNQLPILSLVPVQAELWLDQKCSHYGRVSLAGNIITMSAFGSAHLFSKIPIKKSRVFHIYFMQGKNLALGIIDSSYKQNLLYGYDQPNKIFYQSSKKFSSSSPALQSSLSQSQSQSRLAQVPAPSSPSHLNSNSEQGLGFAQGQVVTLSINLQLGTVFWKVGAELRHSWQTDLLRDPKIQWVPYLRLFEKGDRVGVYQ